jgi:pyrimidine-specific ribonucleoside hydrolase
MMNTRIILSVLLILSSLLSAAHSGKARYHVVVDTDGGLDDLRALTMLLASREVEVIAIHCSDGVQDPATTASNVRALLHTYHHQGIPVLRGEPFIKEVPEMRSRLKKLSWGDKPPPPGGTGNPPMTLRDIIAAEDEKVTLACLASLNTAGKILPMLDDPQEEIEMILWFCLDSRPDKSLNHSFDPTSLKSIEASGVPTRMIVPGDNALPRLDDSFWAEAATVPSTYAVHLAEIHRSAMVKQKLSTGREHIWDELVALYLNTPGHFTCADVPAHPAIECFYPGSPENLAALYLEALEDKKPDYKVFSHLPDDTSYYAEDVRPVIDRIISNHGLPEWRAGILTNEMHGHLGIYAVIGMKMGIRAREYFNIGLDDLRITSLAGLEPPVSCMNDGLQVSTGSSLGHGLIGAMHTSHPVPAAIFSFKGREIRISLRAELSEQIRNEVKAGVKEFGLESDKYWAYIRKLAISYWAEFDRHEIFNIEKNR